MQTSVELFDELKEKSFNESVAVQDYYYSIVEELKYAFDINDEAQRDENIKMLYQAITNQVAKSALIHRGLMSWSDDMYEQYFENTFSSVLAVSAHVEQLLQEIAKENGINYVFKANIGLSNEEYINYIGNLATSVKMKDVQDEFFKQATIESRENSMAKYAGELLDDRNEITYSGNLSNDNDRKISEVYALYNNAWDNIKKAGFFGNLFNLGNFFRNVGLIRKANEIFDKVGFKVKTDGPILEDAFETTADQCAGKDLAYLAELESSFKEDATLAQFKDVKEISVARDKLDNTISAIQNGTMEHPIHKVNAILGKYGASVTKCDDRYRPGRIDGFGADNEELVALEYDKTRQTGRFSGYIQAIFFRGLEKMMGAALKDGKTLNISEVIKDASDIAIVMANDYTVLYEAPELKEIASNSAFGSYNSERIFSYVHRHLNTHNATDKYDLDALKNEIEQTMKEYKNPILEDYKAKEAAEVVNENTELVKTEEPLIEKISVDLSYSEPKLEETQPQITEKEFVKEQISK